MASTAAMTEAVDPLAGHLGHLSVEQQKAFDRFKELCIDEGLCKQAITVAADTNHGIDDDGSLLRFLRARRFNVTAALEQLLETISWRLENDLMILYNDIDIQDFDDTKNLYTHWTGRRDKAGVPLYIFELSHLTPQKMAEYDFSCATRPVPTLGDPSPTRAPVKLLRLFATYEHLIRFVMPLCSAVPGRPNPETPITGTICIIDISGVGLMQFWSLRKHLQDASVLATAHYPETLGRTFVIGAPPFFPTVWGWIKGWFDPITTSKIFIVSPTEVFSTLSTYIAPANIPKKYGGELDFTFGMPPVLDDGVINMLNWTRPVRDPSQQNFPLGPVKWVNGDDGGLVAIAMGGVGSVQRREMVAKLKPSHMKNGKKNGIVATD